MNEERIDELRQRLRSLGYLDAGVARFVLAPARETRGPLALAARASIRMGLLGGALLGPSAALGLGARLPGLVSGVRDALVLALYLSILFFAAVAAAAFAISTAAAAFVRVRDARFPARARTVSAAAGWCIALGCLAYLTFWWRNANAGFGWSAPLWTTFALVVAVSISWLLGYGLRMATLAVLAAAAAGSGAQLPAIPSTSWRVVVGAAAMAFCGAAALLILTAPTATASARAPLAVVSSGKRLLVIAIDGVDPSTPLSVLRGRRAALAARDTGDPARGWTTIATGEPPEVHGVHGLETRRIAGLRGILAADGGRFERLLGAGTDLVRLTRPSIASREERRVKTVWEIAADAGLRTAVVNWWATWPAPAGGGIVVTDRAVLRLEQGGSLDAEIAPPELYPTLQQGWSSIRARAAEAAARHFADVSDGTLVKVLRRSAELDATVIGLLQALPGPARDLDLVYLPGLDIAQHALLTGSGTAALVPSAVTARVDGLRAYYRFLDATLLPLVSARDPEVLVMVLAEPGRIDTPTDGSLSIAGDASSNGGVSRASPLDVAPTILYALGLPLSRELPGHPLRDVLGSAVANAPERYVPTYGRPFAPAAARKGTPLDQEMIDRLRSLGYVK
ncbi:MAG TPA: alkaline phosphatase family protein [Vicinamibacterales bacterium]|nr:alkaline phosphatase family protein [Vicinamibacterales bacterium]